MQDLGYAVGPGTHSLFSLTYATVSILLRSLRIPMVSSLKNANVMFIRFRLASWRIHMEHVAIKNSPSFLTSVTPPHIVCANVIQSHSSISVTAQSHT